MTLNIIKNGLREYRWVIWATCLFIVWKLFLVGIMWDGRAIPPEPDDSFEYIAHIASVSECSSTATCPYPGVSMTDHSGLTYLSYRIFFGLIGRVSGLAPDTVYHLGFYFGTLILPLVLIPFLRSFTADKRIIAWSIVFLAFYHGTGETHGFYWVVPSFFSALLFFLLFAFISRGASIPYWIAGCSAVIFIFFHPMSVYLAALFPLATLGTAFLSKTWDWQAMKRMVFVVFIIVGSAALQSLYLNHLAKTNYYGVSESLSQAKFAMRDLSLDSNSGEHMLSGYQLTTTQYKNLFWQRIDAMRISYFRYVLPHWTAIFPLALVLFILYKNKHFQLLSLYMAALSFFVVATLLNEYGFRSAIILWPLTFVVYAFGSWHMLGYAGRITNPILRQFSGIVLSLGIGCFFALNAILAVAYNSNLNLRHKYSIDPAFATYLETHLALGEKVGLNNILIRTAGGARLFLSQRVGPQNTDSQYLAFIDDSGPQTDAQPRSRMEALSGRILNTLGIHIARAPQKSPMRPPANYSLEKEFGVLKIYRYNP